MKEILITSSVLILALTGLRYLFRHRISRRLQYALWLLVLARLLLPVSLPQSSFSVLTGTEALSQHITETVPAVDLSPVQAPVQAPIQAVSPVGVSAVAPAPAPQAAARLSTVQILWLAGAGLMLLWLLGTNLVFGCALRRSRRRCDIPDCPVPVYVTDAAASPCLFGLFHLAIYLTPRAMETPETLRHVLTHELCHRRHGDHIWSVLRGLCLVIYWFDPLVWLAAILSRADSELACDESAIRSIGQDQRLAYGKTLVDMIAVRHDPTGILCAATTMTSGKRGIQARLRQIVQNPRHLIGAALAALVLTGVFVGCTFTTAKSGSAESPANAISYVETTKEDLAALLPDGGDADLYRYHHDMDGNYKGLRTWVEVWQDGQQIGTYDGLAADLFAEPGDLDLIVREIGQDNDADRTLYFTFAAGDEQQEAEVSIRLDHAYTARATSWLGSGDKPAYALEPDEPAILLCLVYQDEKPVLRVFDCETLMEEPERLADYSCAVVVRCVFTSGEADDYSLTPATDNTEYQASLIRDGQETPLDIDSQLLQEVVFNSLVRSAAWPNDQPVDGYPYAIRIRSTTGDTVRDYYACRRDGAAILMGPDMYTGLSEELMIQLEQAAGVEPGKTYSLDAAIRQAIQREYADEVRGDGFLTASYIILASEEREDPSVASGVSATAYCQHLHLIFSEEDGRLVDEGGGSFPIVLTFAIEDDGAYTLEEYWTPGDGTYYTSSIREKFPNTVEDSAINTQTNALLLRQICYAQAIAHFGLNLDGEISRLLDTICTTASGQEIVNAAAAMEEHSLEYRQLLYYGNETLRYLFREFLTGGQTGARGMVMCRLMQDLLDGQNIGVIYENGQDYFDQWKDYVLELYDRNPPSFFQESAAGLLLEVMGLIDTQAIDADPSTPRADVDSEPASEPASVLGSESPDNVTQVRYPQSETPNVWTALPIENGETINAILSAADWSGAPTDCAVDVLFQTASGETVSYHTDCGTFSWGGHTFRVTNQQRQAINALLDPVSFPNPPEIPLAPSESAVPAPAEAFEPTDSVEP